MTLPVGISKACQALRRRPWGDADRDMTPERVMKTGTGLLVQAFVNADGPLANRRLVWLSFFAARRSLACWELYSDRTGPRNTVAAIGVWLSTGIGPSNWKPFMQPARPTHRGSRVVADYAADNVCAAAAVANAACLVSGGDPFHAVCALSAAATAFDQSPLGKQENFRHWVLEVAVPAAYENRELTAEEQRAFRSYDQAELRVHREKASSWRSRLKWLAGGGETALFHSRH